MHGLTGNDRTPPSCVPARGWGTDRDLRPSAGARITTHPLSTDGGRLPAVDTRIGRLGYWLCAGALGASALFLFASLGTYPIVLWDESRVGVNALEMYLT